MDDEPRIGFKKSANVVPTHARASDILSGEHEGKHPDLDNQIVTKAAAALGMALDKEGYKVHGMAIMAVTTGGPTGTAGETATAATFLGGDGDEQAAVETALNMMVSILNWLDIPETLIRPVTYAARRRHGGRPSGRRGGR